ncbi:MAG: hypothetical protein DRP78_00865 [Candidatus Omnitrophota bacterium]|nr:MAG: hypothetical protein DRP78_00865 [Candidatus Omnitrophota bacterium]
MLRKQTVLCFLIIFLGNFSASSFCGESDDISSFDKSIANGLQFSGNGVINRNLSYKVLSAQMPYVPDAQISNDLKQVIRGLKEANYSLIEIVSFLKKDGYKAFEISIACLNHKFNYTGKQIYDALKKNGFSNKSVDAALPIALRNIGQVFAIKLKDNNNSANNIFIKPNPFTNGIISQISMAQLSAYLVGEITKHGNEIWIKNSVFWDDYYSSKERIDYFLSCGIPAQSRMFIDCLETDQLLILSEIDDASQKILLENVSKTVAAIGSKRKISTEVSKIRSLIGLAGNYLGTLDLSILVPEIIVVAEQDFRHQNKTDILKTEQAIIVNAVVSNTLRYTHPDIEFFVVQVFTKYFADNILFEAGGANIEKSESSVLQAMLSIRAKLKDNTFTDRLAYEAFNLLAGVCDPVEKDILNAFLQADKQIAGGNNIDLILRCFTEKGITADNLPLLENNLI